MRLRLLPLLLLSLSLMACQALSTLGESVNSISDYLLGGEDNTEPPHELTAYKQEIDIELIWKDQVGVGFDEQYVKLVPAVAYGKVFAADREGLIQARDATNGQLLWSVESELPISAGPGVGQQSIVIATSTAEVLALDIQTGEQRWKIKVSSEVLAVPRIEQSIVLVRTTDGKTVALNEADGTELWIFERSVPALSIRGTGSPVIVDDNVISGYANGKLIALRLKDGKLVWETSIAIPKGRSEVERLVDLDVDPVESDGVLFIASYQGGVSGVLALDGDVLWRNEEISSYSGLSYDWQYLYLSDADSDVWQIDQRGGASLWKQQDLHQRRLTAAVVYEDYVVVGDFEGYVHWLAISDGRQLGRISVADEPIEAQPVIVDNIVYVYAKDGTLAALKARLF